MSHKKKQTILIVDDEPINLKVLSENLKPDYNISVATDGETALQLVSAMPPDLILLDIMMEGMDGYEVCMRLKTSDAAEDIPVIFITAMGDTEAELEGLRLGAVDFISKPFNMKAVQSRVKTHLEIKKYRDYLEDTVRKRTDALVIMNQRLSEDILERKRIEEKLQEYQNHLKEMVEERTRQLSEAVRASENARAAAESAGRSRSLFLANMSHELRTPLNAIIGYSEILTEDAESDGMYDMIPDLTKIHDAGKHLLSVIDDILDMSKIEAGKIELSYETFDVTQLIEDTLRSVRPQAKNNGNTMTVQIMPDIGSISADRARVRQSIWNLLSNACKFTQNGMITLTIRGDKTSLLFEVRDTGIGISRDRIKDLFRAFSQIDESSTRKYGGAGLGLAITKNFCLMMGGDVTVESQEGVGSTFTIQLPRTLKDRRQREDRRTRTGDRRKRTGDRRHRSEDRRRRSEDCRTEKE